MIQLFNDDSITFDYSSFTIDAIISDPPYNINYGKKNANYYHFRDKVNNNLWRGGHKARPDFDDKAVDISFMFSMNIKKMAIFGMNNNMQYIPLDLFNSGSFMAWDKHSNDKGRVISDKIIGSGFELIWMYPKMKMDFIRYVYAGLFGTEHEDTKKRLHPTQKPVAVMVRLIELLKLKPGSTILDPFMGSGSTGLACIRTGMNFIGIEKEKYYFDIAKKRLEFPLIDF
jgi:DNA modification methylase